jgi:hypothetical protein
MIPNKPSQLVINRHFAGLPVVAPLHAFPR